MLGGLGGDSDSEVSENIRAGKFQTKRMNFDL